MVSDPVGSMDVEDEIAVIERVFAAANGPVVKVRMCTLLKDSKLCLTNIIPALGTKNPVSVPPLA